MADYILALRKEPGKAWKTVDVRNRLGDLQHEVGGYIETVTMWPDATVICDEEGRLKCKSFNCEISGVGFVGTILIVGVAGEEFDDVPDVFVNELNGVDGEFFDL